MREFIAALGRLLAFILDYLQARNRRQAQQEAQASADAISDNPAREFINRFGVREPLPGANTDTPSPNAAKSDSE